MSVAELVQTLAATQKQLVKALQDEYFCDDVAPPAEAFGWSEADLRAYMESGGESAPPSSLSQADVSDPTPPAPAPAPPPPPPLPALAAPPMEGEDCFKGRPIILCLGDATTEFGSHVINLPSADLGSSKHKASLSVVVEPVATEFLRGTETDNPGVEHGPGWLTLLSRDYAWRTTADVINRGYSGYNSAMLRADLPAILGPLRRQDVRAVTLFIGANDCVAEGESTHVSLAEYRANMAAILEALSAALPNAKVIVIGPAPLDEGQWKETATKLTAGRKKGAERSAARHAEYSKAAGEVAAAAKAPFIDLVYKLKYEMANAMMELQNPHRDGLHLTKAVNIFLYRNLKTKVGECAAPPSTPRNLAAQHTQESSRPAHPGI
jgi:lysophospholipase L1-like esterase